MVGTCFENVLRILKWFFILLKVQIVFMLKNLCFLFDIMVSPWLTRLQTRLLNWYKLLPSFLNDLTVAFSCYFFKRAIFANTETIFLCCVVLFLLQQVEHKTHNSKERRKKGSVITFLTCLVMQSRRCGNGLVFNSPVCRFFTPFWSNLLFTTFVFFQLKKSDHSLYLFNKNV